MRLLKIFKNKPLTRLELKSHSKSSKFRLRASRTSGINAAVHPLSGITFNTKHGLRASKTFKGLTLGFQKGNSVVRGRWSTKNGLFNLNLSKSGFSLSSKSKYATFNFSNPNRSSFKMGGIQLRGKKAKGLAFIATVFNLIPFIINTIIALPIMMFRILISIFNILEFFVKLTINVFIFFFRLIQAGYELLLFIFIDIPKQIHANIVAQKNLDSSNTELEKNLTRNTNQDDEIKTKANTNFESLNASDPDLIESLKNRLSSYSTSYSEITFFQKFLKTVLAGVGFISMFIGVLMVCMLFYPPNSNPIDFIIFVIICSILLIVLGRRLTKPFFKLRQQKIDEESKEILGI